MIRRPTRLRESNRRERIFFISDISRSFQIRDDEKSQTYNSMTRYSDGFDRCENVAAVGTALTFPSKKAFRWRCNSVRHRNYFGVTTAIFIRRRQRDFSYVDFYFYFFFASRAQRARTHNAHARTYESGRILSLSLCAIKYIRVIKRRGRFIDRNNSSIAPRYRADRTMRNCTKPRAE